MAGISLVGCEKTDPTVGEYLVKSGIQKRDTIRIGVLTDVPLLGEQTNGIYTGFDVEFGRYLAKSLGFQTENDRDIVWVPTTLEDRERHIQEGSADLVLATYSITDDRKKRINFAGPYLITSQEVMVDKSLAGKIANLADIERLGLEVCLPGATTTQVNLAGYNIKTIANVNSKSCFDGLVSGKYKVFTTDEVVLAGFNSTVENRFQIINIPLEFTEQYGVGMSKDNPYLQALVEHYMQKSFDALGEDSPWQAAWNKTLKKAEWPSPNGRRQPRPQISQRLRDTDDRNQQSIVAMPAGRDGAWAVTRPASGIARRRPRRAKRTRARSRQVR